jgi:hypothetical protein
LTFSPCKDSNSFLATNVTQVEATMNNRKTRLIIWLSHQKNFIRTKGAVKGLSIIGGIGDKIYSGLAIRQKE